MLYKRIFLVSSVMILPMCFIHSAEILEINAAKEINADVSHLIKLNDMEVPKHLRSTKTCNENSTCKNGGSCLQHICICLPGTSGPFCEIIDECVDRLKPLCDPKAEDTSCQYDISKQKAFCFCHIMEARYDATTASCKVCLCNYWYREDREAWYDCHWGTKGEKICYCTEGHAYDTKEEICSDCVCGEHSKWCEIGTSRNKVCVCKDGYKPHVEGECEECDCGEHGSCTFPYYYRRGPKKCICDPGYTDLNGTCVECDCGNYGKCMLNPDGEKFCECEHQYSEKEGICEFCFCGDNSSCVFDGKTKVCHCQKGYENVHGFCMDIDECKNNPCGDTRNCINTVGNYKCECKQGYQPRVEKVILDLCEDINECKDSKICTDPNTECMNTPGSYKCMCKSGFASRGDVGSNSYCEKTAEWSIYTTVLITAFIAVVVSAGAIIIAKKDFQSLSRTSDEHEMR